MVHYLSKIKKRNYVILSILMVVYGSNVMFTTFELPAKRTSTPYTGDPRFAGSASCAGCHKNIYESHIKTAHYLDSRPASKQFIKGNFAPGKNKFVYNKWMEVVMEQSKDSFFQAAFMNGIEYQRVPFDIVVGSGRKGQTYLYWNEDMLYQLPVSYYTPLNNWCISPGFSSNYIKFDRIIPAQCLECHSTYAKVLSDKDNVSTYDKSRMIYGIDCERCHGPAADHVSFHKEHPAENQGKYLANISQQSRQQKLDACALCHSGFRQPKQAAFSFSPGDKLDDYSSVGYKSDSISTLDVHGNQYGLLTASKCFKVSQMDCSSCHNPHVNEANSPAIFSQRCISCHTESKHTSLMLSSSQQLLLHKNCVDCHMPLLPSQKIVLTVANEQNVVPDMVRTHRVAIYPELSKQLVKQLKSQQ